MYQISVSFIILAWLEKIPTPLQQLLSAFQEQLFNEQLIDMTDDMMRATDNLESYVIKTYTIRG